MKTIQGGVSVTIGPLQSMLADEVGMSRSALYRALHHPSRRAERVIADAVGVSPQELFRERYDQYGLHISARRNRGPATEPLQFN